MSFPRADAATASTEWRSVQELASIYLPPSTPEADEFLAALGRAVLAWNMAEGIMRLMLESMAQEDGPIGDISLVALTNDLGGITLENAVHRLATSLFKGERLDDIQFCAKRFGKIRDHRNHYFHGITHLETAPVVQGVIISRGGKKKIRYRYERVSADDLDEFSKWCAENSAYAKAVIEGWHPIVIDGECAPKPDRPADVPVSNKNDTLLPTSPRR